MSLAVTHVIPTIFAFRYVKEKFFSRENIPLALFFVALGSLLPDVDIAINYILEMVGYGLAHRTITHTPFFALCFVPLALLSVLFRKRRIAIYFLLITAGITSHLLVDYSIGGGSADGIMWFFPLSDNTYKIYALSLFPMKYLPETLDAIILLVWIYFNPPSLSKARK